MSDARLDMAYEGPHRVEGSRDAPTEGLVAVPRQGGDSSSSAAAVPSR